MERQETVSKGVSAGEDEVTRAFHQERVTCDKGIYRQLRGVQLTDSAIRQLDKPSTLAFPSQWHQTSSDEAP